VRAERGREVDEESVEVRKRVLVDVLDLVEHVMDQPAHLRRLGDPFVEGASCREEDPELPEEDRLDDVGRGEGGRGKLGSEDEDPRVGVGEEVDDVGVDPRLQVEDDVGSLQGVDRVRQRRLLVRRRSW